MKSMGIRYSKIYLTTYNGIYKNFDAETVENKDFWNMPLAKAMPLHLNIDKEGVHV